MFERWHYAFNGIMDVHIRRVSRMWSWSNIRQHRHNLKAYRTAYKSKLVSKVNQDTEQQIQVLNMKKHGASAMGGGSADPGSQPL